MRARRKGSNNPFVSIDRIQLEGSDVLYKPEVIEFDIQPDDIKIPVESITNEESYWKELRNRAAISAMQALLSIPGNINNAYCINKSIDYADALIKELRK